LSEDTLKAKWQQEGGLLRESTVGEGHEIRKSEATGQSRRNAMANTEELLK